ncbi:hypothetical protein CDLVIII_1832 [Clostridium sp. DL-VIII]|uniref:DNRLRE domain-containing protein n=1 Tax=Clostridium sp. DL-VIII TaxID=641107 RepID=UPI00023AFF7C|nr:DNRLRE domain-containing protein [Clostridium sp. DL-VIII]EHI98519.1 hypothetical protein CDLVIII_1832 [Clostridium sp. DL-VIII]
MENFTEVKCSATTYLCNIKPNINFSNEGILLVGSINNKSQNYNVFKSLMQFYIPDSDIDSSKRIYLYLFLENLHYAHNNFTISISLHSTDSDINVSTVNWLTCPKRNALSEMNINIPSQSTKKYIKIDISNIIKSLNSNTNIYNIVLEPLNLKPSYMIQFDSSNSENPPYLVAIKDFFNNEDSSNSPEIDNSDFDTSNNTDADTDIDSHSDNDNYNTEINEELENEDISLNDKFNTENSSDKIINELNTQNSKFDKLEHNLLNLIDSFSTVVDNVKNNSAAIDNDIVPTINKFAENFSNINNSTDILKNYIEDHTNSYTDFSTNLSSKLNELIKTEIENLKTSVNNDLLQLKNSNAQNISDLDGLVKNISSDINDNINLLKSPIEKLLDQTNSTMETILNNLIKTEIDALKNSVENLNSKASTTSDSAELLKNEINALKNSVNDDISLLHSYVASSVSSLNDSIKGINETLSQLSAQLSKLSEAKDTINHESI